MIGGQSRGPGGRLSGDALRAFSQSTKLAKLELVEVGGVDAKNLSAISPDCLLELYLSGANITDKEIEALQRFEHLEKLSVGSPKITNKGVLSLAKLKSLKELHISASPQVDLSTFVKLTGLLDLGENSSFSETIVGKSKWDREAD